MSEHENDPQRPAANVGAEPSHTPAEPSHPTAELPRVDRGQTDHAVPSAGPAAAGADSQTSPAGPAPTGTGHTDPVAATPAEPFRYLDPSGPDTVAGSPAPATAPGQAPSAPASPAAPGPYGPVAGMPAPSTSPYPPSQWHPAYAQTQETQPYAHTQENQPGWMGNPSYPGQHAIGPGPAQTPGYGGTPPPPWGPTHSASGPTGGPSRVGKLVAVGAAALALMLGSGLAGGVIALAIHGNSPASIVRNYSAAPVINSADLPKIAASVTNSVVSINTGTGEGSGVVLTADGYILTNNHVVASASGNTVKVVFADGKTLSATIVGTDPKSDLGVVKVSGASNLAPAKFGNSDAMQVGDTVLALGSPLGLQGSVTAGIISARDRTIQAGSSQPQPPTNPFQPQPQQQAAPTSSISGLLQTDAPINPGNSGGALINTKGEVIGINTAIATSGQSSGNIGVGFAIPSNKASVVAQALRQGQKVSHPSLGVSVGNADPTGALVSAVTPGSPAQKAGLQQGDVITQFGGKTINGSNDLVGAVQSGKVGDTVPLTYTRNGAQKTATVTLAETP